tara:strand:- start:1851 stop:2252 length:402 start_codon:yes stop_codon:yes gene_type:complete
MTFKSLLPIAAERAVEAYLAINPERKPYVLKTPTEAINPKAVELCGLLYQKLEPLHIFPALTGGQLYKDGQRKDIDIILYRGSHGGALCQHDIYMELTECGIFMTANFGRVIKGHWQGYEIDLILPEAPEGSY